MPILETLRNGVAIRRVDLTSKVFDQYYAHLPEELLDKKLRTGGSL